MTHLVVITFSDGRSDGYRIEADDAKHAIKRLEDELLPLLKKEKGLILVSAGKSEETEVMKL